MKEDEEKKFVEEQIKSLEKQKQRAIKRAEDLGKKVEIFSKYLRKMERD